jgi:hypothetical protein
MMSRSTAQIPHKRFQVKPLEELPAIETLKPLIEMPASSDELKALRFDILMLLGTGAIIFGTGYLYLYEFGYRRRRRKWQLDEL